jgi:hypothetical protein
MLADFPPATFTRFDLAGALGWNRAMAAFVGTAPASALALQYIPGVL